MPTSPIDKATLVDWMEWVRMASLGLYEINKRRGRRPLETFSDPATDPQTDTGIQMNRTEAVAATYFRELFARYITFHIHRLHCKERSRGTSPDLLFNSFAGTV